MYWVFYHSKHLTFTLDQCITCTECALVLNSNGIRYKSHRIFTGNNNRRADMFTKRLINAR